VLVLNYKFFFGVHLKVLLTNMPLVSMFMNGRYDFVFLIMIWT
jgi:hypothetical protein